MSQFSTMESPPRAAQGSALKPALQQALQGLDVQLEEELTRYRRSRAGKPSTPRRSVPRSPARKSLDLINIKAVGGRTQPQPASPAPDTAADEATVVLPLTPGLGTEAEAKTFTGGALVALPTEAPKAQAAPEPPVAGGSLVDPSVAAPPDDYLESSEELLRSLDDSAQVSPADASWTAKVMTPLGLGSMVLFLLACVSFGVVIVNPSILARRSAPATSTAQTQPETVDPASLPQSPNLASQEFVDLQLGSLSTLTTKEKTAPAAGSTVPAPSALTPPQPSTTSAAGRSPSRPATGPGVLSSLASAVGIRPRTPAVAPAPVQSAPVQPAPVQPPAAYNPPPVVSVPQAPAYQPPAPPQAPEPPSLEPQAAEPAPPEPPAEVAAAPTAPDTDYYYVVGNYSGDRSLEEAQSAVPNAYVRNFNSGAQIQYGAFTDAAGAQELAERLQQQGLSAEVYQPE